MAVLELMLLPSDLHFLPHGTSLCPDFRTASETERRVKRSAACHWSMSSDVISEEAAVSFRVFSALFPKSKKCVQLIEKKRPKTSNMAGKKDWWQSLGEGFVQEYYNQFDNTNRMTLANLYTPDATLTWEGAVFRGRDAIAGKLVGMPFSRIKHIITEQDFQPTVDGCALIMVFGQLQIDEERPMAFHQVFMLKFQNGSWSCTNDVFRLGIHNIPT